MKEITIEAGRTSGQYWRDLWNYRDLFSLLAWRDILVRYKQTVFGIAWSWLRPLLVMVSFTLVFGKLAKLPSGDTPYVVMVSAALLPWQFFANAFGAAATSLVDNANIISKVYFPRLIVPSSSVIVCLVDFLIAGVLQAVLMAWYGVIPDWHLVLLPVLVVLTCLLALGLGLLVGALNVRYRDFRYVVPFLMQVGLYVSPVGFSSAIVPEQWRILFALNPMVPIIEGFRWSLFAGQAPLHMDELAVASAVTLVFLWVGIRYFRKTEQLFADVI